MRHLILLTSCILVILSIQSNPIFALPAVGSQEMTVDYIDGTRFQFANPEFKSSLSKGHLNLNILDGKVKSILQPTHTEFVQKVNGAVELQADYPSLGVNVTVTPCNQAVFFSVTLTNRTGNELWLEPILSAVFDRTSEPLSFWPGFDAVYPIGNKPINRSPLWRLKNTDGAKGKPYGNIMIPFPACSVFENREGLSLGGVPFAPLSYSMAKYSPVAEKKGQLAYSYRIVLDAHQSLTVDFYVGSYISAYGGDAGAIQLNYDTFVKEWAPYVGQDNPYIWGTDDNSNSWWGLTKSRQQNRRLFSTMSWGYCPYKRAGDLVGRPELWDYQKFIPEEKLKDRIFTMFGHRWPAEQYFKFTNQEFRTLRTQAYRKYGRQFGWMFYNSGNGQWCEKKLAEDRYADSFVRDPDAKCEWTTPWSTSYDHEFTLFTLGTQWGEQFKKDLKELVDELDLPGFALDLQYAGYLYRGPAVKKPIPGKAWDEKGVFVSRAVAMGEMTDYIRQLHQSTKPSESLVVWSNGYLKGDTCMYEASELDVVDHTTNFPYLRYMMGPRPAAYHGHGYSLDQYMNTPQIKDMTQAELLKLVDQMADYVILTSFQYGIFPTGLTMQGTPQVLYNMPELEECQRAGWQACIPVVLSDRPEGIYHARYGRRAGSLLFLGNSGEKTLEEKIKIDNKVLGNYDYIFIEKKRQSSHGNNHIKNGFTSMTLNLLSRTPVLLEALCGLKPEKAVQVQASSEKDIDQEVYRIEVTSEVPFTSPIEIRDRRNFMLTSLILNGRPISFKKIDGKYEAADLAFSAGITKLELRYQSVIFQTNRQRLLEFPFQDSKGDCYFTIVLPSEPNSMEEDAAAQLQEYFQFYTEKKMPGQAVRIHVVRGYESATTGPVVFLAFRPEVSKLIAVIDDGIGFDDSGRLIVRSKDEIAGREMMTQLQSVMDDRFEYVFPFTPLMGMNMAFQKHFKLEGISLPYRQYHETN